MWVDAGRNLGLRCRRRREGFGDVIEVCRRSFRTFQRGIAFAVMVIDVGDGNKIVWLDDQADRLGLTFRILNRGS